MAAPSGRDAFRAERCPAGDNLTDIAVDDRRCYVVGYRWKNAADPRQGAVVSVSASADLTNWSKLFSFHADTFASAIEVIDGDVYLGRAPPASTAPRPRERS